MADVLCARGLTRQALLPASAALSQPQVAGRCHEDLLDSKPLSGPEKHSETLLAIIPDTRLAPGCATWGMKKLCYFGPLAPGTLKPHEILELTEGPGVRVILNIPILICLILQGSWYVQFSLWALGAKGVLSSGFELGRLCGFWQTWLSKKSPDCAAFMSPNNICVFLALFLSAGL